MSFSSDLSRFVQKTNLKADVVLRKVAMDGLRGVVMMTPVDTGRCRGSWRVGINTFDLTTEPEGNQHKGKGPGDNASAGAAKALSDGNKQIAQAKFGDVIAITNNLHYAPALEDGHSKQAPDGMLRPTFDRIRAQIKRMAGA